MPTIKCHRAVCSEEGEHRHTQTGELYCTCCAMKINRYHEDQGFAFPNWLITMKAANMAPLQAMQQITAQLIAEGIESPYAINNGNCEDWANEVFALIKDNNFPVEIWATVPNHGDTSHIFLKIDGKFYDAEDHTGQADFMRLPLFSKIGTPQPVWREDHNGKCVGKGRINFTKAQVIAYNKANCIDWIKTEDIEPD